jgi:hypothetical protein
MSDDVGAAPAGGGAAVAGAHGSDLGTGAEIAVGDGTPAGGAGAGGAGAGGRAKDGSAKRQTFKEALEQVRAAVNATAGQRDPMRGAGEDGGEDGADEGGDDAPAESAEDREARLGALSSEEREQVEADEAAAESAAAAGDEVLIVDLGPAREGEEPIRIQAEDQQMADHIRSLINRAATHQTSLKIREEAEGFRAQAEEMQYDVQLDPGGFLLANLAKSGAPVQDAAHVAKLLLTRPGVLASIKDWVVALAATPAALDSEAKIMNAERVERRQKVEPQVKRLKFENQNARACVRKAYDVVEALAPATWKPEQQNEFVRDIIRDLNDLQQSEKVRVTNPDRIKGLVERRLARIGVAPRSAKAGRAGAIPGRPGSKTPARTGPSGQELVRTDAARRRAAGPGPGAGSPAARIPKPPAGTKLTGKNNVFDHVRKILPALRRAPT